MGDRSERARGGGGPQGACLLPDCLIGNSLTRLSTTRSEWRDSSTERRIFDFLREALFFFRTPAEHLPQHPSKEIKTTTD